jgi:thioredoxin reductase (NADPH)
VSKRFDVAIIGAGAAGLSATIAARQLGLEVLLLERSMPGGKLNTYQTLENFPGYEHLNAQTLGLKLYEEVTQLGVQSTYGDVHKLIQDDQGFTIQADSGEFLSKTVVIASGTKEKPLTIPGAEALFGQGISYCAACDGGFFQGKDVAVIGGDSHAIEETIFLANMAHQIYLLLPPGRPVAAQQLISKVSQLHNVTVIQEATPIKVLGEQVVTGLIYQSASQGQQELMVDGIFPILGWAPSATFVQSFPALLHNDGYLLGERDGNTAIPGLFVIGDVQAKITRLVKNVIAQGNLVAQQVHKFLHI